MVYPFLEVAHRVWLNQTGEGLGNCPVGPDEEDGCEISYADDDENFQAIGELLDRIARASPEEKVLNSLLYWLLDLSYRSMLDGVSLPPWDPEPYVLRLPGVEERMVAEVGKMGHVLQLLYRSEHREQARGAARSSSLLLVVLVALLPTLLLFLAWQARGEQLILQVKQAETTNSVPSILSRPRLKTLSTTSTTGT